MKNIIAFFLGTIVFTQAAIAADSKSIWVDCIYKYAVTDKTATDPVLEKWPVTETKKDFRIEMKGSQDLQRAEVSFDIPNSHYATKFTLMRIDGRSFDGEVAYSSWGMTYEKKPGAAQRLVIEKQGSNGSYVEGKHSTYLEMTNRDLTNLIAQLGYSAEEALNLPGNGTEQFYNLVNEGKIPNGMLFYQYFYCSYPQE